MPPTKYGKYVTRDIIGESKYPQITTPIARYQGCRGGGNAMTCEWSCITKPLIMDDEPEVDNERDQFLLFGSSNIDDGEEFRAEIELPLGKEGKKFVIDEPTYVYIPKGLVHGPVRFKAITKPITFLSYFLAPEYSTEWVAPDPSKYVSKISDVKRRMPPPKPGAPPCVQQMDSDGKALRHIRINMQVGLAYELWSSIHGWPAKVSPVYMVNRDRDWFFTEPVHAHRASHQISMYLGSNPLDIEDFDAKIEIFMGKEREEHVIDTCAVDHYVPGIVHMGDEVRRVNKPFVKIMWAIGPDMNDYFRAAAKDKVVLSDESKGETMVSEGALDYVPPTKMEDWVWPYPEKE